MFILVTALLIVGYDAVYFGISNLMNPGKGSKFWAGLNVTQSLSTPAGVNFSPNLTGQPASAAQPPPGGTVLT